MEPNYWTRWNKKRISRRAVLGGGATVALGGAAAAIAGCGGGDDGGATTGPTRTPATDPVAGGSITLGRPVTVLGIDPHQDLTGLDIDQRVYPYLYSWIPGSETMIFNNMATDIERPDDTTFIFPLRRGVTNAPYGAVGENEELTSADVKASFNRRGTSISAPDKRFPRYIAGSSDPSALEPALETPDDFTFRFTMAEPFVPALREMANPTWAIVHRDVIEEFGSGRLAQSAYGAGPFMLEEFRGNERVVLRKNPNYFIQDRPYLDGQTIVVITENSSLISAFEQGQHDVNGAVLDKEDFDEFSENPDYTVARAPSLFYPVVHMKMIRPPFDQIRVRQAIDMAINREELIAVIWKGEGEYNGPIQWPQIKWALPDDELRAHQVYDPDGAKQLLAEAGFPDGFATTMKLPQISGVSFIADMATVLAAQWAQVGINVQLDEVELGSYIGSTLLTGNFDMTFFPNLPYDEPDRPLSFYHSLGVTGSGNWTNYANPDLDELINLQARQTVESERQETIYAAQRLILEEYGPQLTLPGGYAYSARWNYVHFPWEIDGDPQPDSNPPFVDMWTENA